MLSPKWHRPDRSPGLGAGSIMQSNVNRMAAQLAGLYAVIATGWILLSDKILLALHPDAERLSMWQSFKGVFFVAVTTGLLAVMARKYLRKTEAETTTRLQSAERLRSQARETDNLRTALDEHAIVSITDAKGKITYVNDKFCKISQYSREELIGQDHRLINSGHHPKEYIRQVWTSIIQGLTWHGEFKNRAKDGSFYWVDATIVPFPDENGKPTKYVSIRTDITGRKQTEEQLRKDEELLREVNRVTGLGIFEHDHQTDVIYWSPEQRRHYGWGATEPVTLQDVINCAHPEDKEKIAAAIRQAHDPAGNGRYDVEHRIVRRDGALRWIMVRSQSYFEGEGADRYCRLTVGAELDITERKSAEEELNSERTLLRTLFDLLPDYIYIKDEQSRFIACNDHCARGMGAASPQAVIGRTDADFYPSDLAAKFRAQELAVLAGTPLLDHEDVFRRPDGQNQSLLTTKLPLRDRSGKITGIVGTGRDITERKLLEEKFLRVQRLEAIGTLAGGVAHDLNNILAPMLMAAGLLKDKMVDQRDRDILLMVEHGAQRGASIIGQLLTFSRGIEGERVSVQLRHLVKELTHMMHETFPRNITIECQTPPDLWCVMADGTQLHQVLLNLCVNARDAMSGGGKLTLEAANVELGDARVRTNPQAKPGPHVVISVSDTGHGIPPTIIHRIFDPFFTTKGVGKGTGLGLSTVMGIVKSHGGFLTVYSEPGRGTVFKVYLPAQVEAVVPQAGKSSAPASTGHNELILVVDDEDMICEMMNRTFLKHGYRVLIAHNGGEALQLFIQHHGAVQLVVTDVMMPVMGGVELIQSLRVLDPHVRVIASSGLDQDARRAELRAMGVTDLLNKPFGAPELLKMVERVLHSRPAV
jgi:PAS domain S-box-containing protein